MRRVAVPSHCVRRLQVTKVDLPCRTSYSQLCPGCIMPLTNHLGPRGLNMRVASAMLAVASGLMQWAAVDVAAASQPSVSLFGVALSQPLAAPAVTQADMATETRLRHLQVKAARSCEQQLVVISPKLKPICCSKPEYCSGAFPDVCTQACADAWLPFLMGCTVFIEVRQCSCCTRTSSPPAAAHALQLLSELTQLKPNRSTT